MKQSYYNTTGAKGSELEENTKKASKQEDVILAVFKKYRGIEMTPFEVMKKVKSMFGEDYIITSVRRAISNLEKDSTISKTSTRKMGDYGHFNYCWVKK